MTERHLVAARSRVVSARCGSGTGSFYSRPVYIWWAGAELLVITLPF